jgi:hypothetical protein
VILVTDCITNRQFNGVQVFSAGNKLEMPARIKSVICSVKTDYVFLTLDDYFVKDKILDSDIESVLSFICKNNVDYFRLFPIPNDKKSIIGHKGWNWIDLETNYAVNLYPGIWKRSFLEKVLDCNLSPWEFEVTLSKKAKKENAICVMSKNNEFPILDVVRKGKVLHKAKRYLESNNLNIGNRPVISYWVEIKLKIFGIGSRILPNKIAKYIRNILHNFGMKFYSDGTCKNNY